MSSANGLIFFFGSSLLLFIKDFILWLLKALLGLGIVLGLLENLTPFPLIIISGAQELIRPFISAVPGGVYLGWIADNSLWLAVLVIFVLAVRVSHILRAVVQTSHHAAFAASALTNYLDIEATTKTLLKLEKDLSTSLKWSFWKTYKRGIPDRIFTMFTGLPFLPVDAIPARKGEAVNIRYDIQEYVSSATARSPSSV